MIKLNSYNILVLGLGNVGLGYDLKGGSTLLTHVKSIKVTSKIMKINVTLYAVEPDASKRASFEKEYPEDYSFSNYELIPDTKFDLAIVCCNTEFIIKSYLGIISKFQINKIILEKPVAHDFTSFKNLVSRKSNNQVLVGFPRRTLPSSHFLKNLIQNSAQDCKWKLEMNIFGDMRNIGTHFLDLVYFFFGAFEIRNYEETGGLVSFDANSENIDLRVNQKSVVNQEISSIHITGPLDIEYEQSGRLITIECVSLGSKLMVGSSFEIEQMIGFESLDYLNWMVNNSCSNLPTLLETPIAELLLKGNFQ